MKKSYASAALLLGLSVLTGACAKHDDAINAATTNETVVTDETVDLNGAGAADAIANDGLGDAGAGNSGIGNAAATPN